MTVKGYYYTQFRLDFQNFWKKIPTRSNYVTGKPLFKFAGLVKRDQFDVLGDISKENLIYCLSALACTILVDQVMYTHFKEDYPEFQRLTKYPKMEIGWMNANPWMVFEQNVRLSRNLQKPEAILRFSEFAEFFVEAAKGFFEKQKILKTNWAMVKDAMLNDNGVKQGEFGQIFYQKLKII